MKFRRKPGGADGLDTPEAGQDLVRLIKADLRLAGEYPCAACGKWSPTTFLLPYSHAINSHQEPQMVRKAMKDGHFQVREGPPDTRAPLCNDCFKRAGAKVLREKAQAWEAKAQERRQELNHRLDKIKRTQAESERALEQEIAQVEAELAGMAVDDE